MITLTKLIEFRVARWELPDGSTFIEELPAGYKNNHFGPELRKHIIYQVHQNGVTQEKVRRELIDKGIDISVGQINNILAKATNDFTYEYYELGKAGIQTSDHLRTDDTSNRHQGKNGSTNVIGNDLFTHFFSSDSKSRINFLKILGMQKNPNYTINDDAFKYAKQHNLPTATCEWLIVQQQLTYTKEQFEALFNSIELSIQSVRIINEACLYASCIANGLPEDLIILSDGAPQFAKILTHALCWIHAERAIKKIIPCNEQEVLEIKNILDLVWAYYRELSNYRLNPLSEQKDYLSQRFDEIFSITIESLELAAVLKKFRNKKAELLCVLDHPNVPLHTNGAERDIRPFVIKKKISGGTRSDLGRLARDVFASLFQTCNKNGISVWKYLDDRIKRINVIPNIGDVVRLRNLKIRSSPQF